MLCDFYITSFCGKNPDINLYHRENGLLSMWRNYGADGGCAIIFKTKNIHDRICNFKETLKDFSLIMDEVTYEGHEGHNDNQSDFLNKLSSYAQNLSNFIKSYEENTSKGKQDILFDQLNPVIENQMHLMVLTKHQAFFEEREVRMALFFFDENKKDAKIIDIPPEYHEIPFSPMEDITRIIIGPHRNQQERYDFLTSYLSKFGLKNIEVTKSEIPLRT